MRQTDVLHTTYAKSVNLLKLSPKNEIQIPGPSVCICPWSDVNLLSRWHRANRQFECTLINIIDISIATVLQVSINMKQSLHGLYSMNANTQHWYNCTWYPSWITVIFQVTERIVPPTAGTFFCITWKWKLNI